MDANVTWSSTSIFESDINGVPSLLYEPVNHIVKFRPIGIENYEKITCFNDIKKLKLNEIKDKQLKQKIYSNYIGDVDGKSSYRIVDAVVKIINDEEITSKFVGYNWKRYIRQYCYELLTRVFVKTRLLKVIKFPRSAFAEMRDIPYIDNNLD